MTSSLHDFFFSSGMINSTWKNDGEAQWIPVWSKIPQVSAKFTNPNVFFFLCISFLHLSSPESSNLCKVSYTCIKNERASLNIYTQPYGITTNCGRQIFCSLLDFSSLFLNGGMWKTNFSVESRPVNPRYNEKSHGRGNVQHICCSDNTCLQWGLDYIILYTFSHYNALKYARILLFFNYYLILKTFWSSCWLDLLGWIADDHWCIEMYSFHNHSQCFHWCGWNLCNLSESNKK